MKVDSFVFFTGAYVIVDGNDYVRYSGKCWKTIVDTPTGDIETDISDISFEEKLEAAYQEHINKMETTNG